MGCYFSLVQLFSDNLSDDHITIGMIAVNDDDSSAAARFVGDWSRASSFSDIPTTHIKTVIGGIESRFWDESALFTSAVTLDQLKEMIGSYHNAIRLTSPEHVERSAEDWVTHFAHQFIRDLDARRRRRPSSTQPQVADTSRKLLKELLHRRFQLRSAERVVDEWELVSTYKTPRSIDAAVRNGRLHFGAVALSLDHPAAEAQSNVDRAFTRMYDLKTALPDIPLIGVTDIVSNAQHDPERRHEDQIQLAHRFSDLGLALIEVSDEARIERELEKVMTPEILQSLAAD
ncbi:MAG: hypothetical protein KF883_10195 [Thermomicrobiales bacterium]|nr:hypothetical protein [Thermomicrobiales bacterium]